MKAIKVIAIVVVLLVALVVGGIIFGLWQIDKLAKLAIEEGGTYALQVDTTVQKVDISVLKGKASLDGLDIANPAGFKTDHFLKLNDASATVNLESIETNTVVIPSITLDGIDVILDKGGDPSNYNTILNSLKRFESKDEGSGGTGSGATKPKGEGGKKVVIDSLKIKDINIHVANMPGVSLALGDVAVHIPEIELKDVGKDKPMTTAEVINLVVKTVLAAAVEAGGGIIPTDVLNDLGNGLAGLSSLSDLGIKAISDLNLDKALGGVQEQVDKAAKDVQGKLDDATKKVGDQVEDAKKQVEDKIDDATKNIKDIFGGKKKDGP